MILRKMAALLAPAALLGAAALLPTAAHAQSAHHHTAGINQRLREQHARIHAGVQSGALTRREAEQVRRRDARIHAQEARDRRHHHGHLTPAERRHLNTELNRDSRAIHHQKHDRQVR